MDQNDFSCVAMSKCLKNGLIQWISLKMATRAALLHTMGAITFHCELLWHGSISFSSLHNRTWNLTPLWVNYSNMISGVVSWHRTRVTNLTDLSLSLHSGNSWSISLPSGKSIISLLRCQSVSWLRNLEAPWS